MHNSITLINQVCYDRSNHDKLDCFHFIRNCITIIVDPFHNKLIESALIQS